MKQLRTIAAISAVTLITAAPTFAEQHRAMQGQTGVTGGQTTPTLAAEKAAHQDLVARVEAALRADPALMYTNLVVLSAGSGGITLSGWVDTKAQAARAVQVARNVTGVTRIEDNDMAIGQVLP